MKVHGRLTPGRLVDLRTPLELRIHAPARASGVTIKIWEMDTFPSEDGAARENTDDDLLATFTATIETTSSGAQSRAADWRAIRVASATIAEAPDEIVRFKLRLAGTDAVYDVPILSEAGEAEGDDFEIGFSIEIGGSEQFRTKSPTLISVPIDPVRVVEARFGLYDDRYQSADDSLTERPMALRYAAFGICEGDPDTMQARLKVLGNGHIDSHGFLVVHPDERDAGSPDTVTQARSGRGLYLFVHDDPTPLELGASKIQIARCDRIGDQGITRVPVPDRSHTSGARIAEAEQPRAELDGRLRYDHGPLAQADAPRRFDTERVKQAFRRFAAKFSGS